MKQFTHLMIAIAFGVSSSAVAQSESTATPVEVVAVQQQMLAPTAEILGTVHSRNHVSITAAVNGQLTWLAAPGSVVAKGDPLVKMDTFLLELAQLEQKAMIKREQINIDYLKRELERLVTLQANNNAAEFELDQNRSRYELAVADLEIAELKLKQIEDQLARANVVAPFDGVVTERLQREGTDVSRADLLLKLVDTENLEVHLHVPVRYLGNINPAKELQLSNRNQQMQAQINAIIPAADPRSQTVELRLTLPRAASSEWTAGELVRVEIPVAEPQQSVVVHRDALILRRQGTHVMVIDADGVAHQQQVTVGAGHGDYVAIEGNVTVGDYVAVRGAERLQQGQTVAIRPNNKERLAEADSGKRG